MIQEDLTLLNTAITKLDKTQSLIKGIRLGFSANVSQQNQNIEEILKLINLDLYEIYTTILSFKENFEQEQTEETEQQINEIQNETQTHEETIEHPASELFNTINQNFGNEINNDFN